MANRERGPGRNDLSTFISRSDPRLTVHTQTRQQFYEQQLPPLVDKLTSATHEVKKSLVVRLIDLPGYHSVNSFFPLLDNVFTNSQSDSREGGPLRWDKDGIELLVDSLVTNEGLEKLCETKTIRTVETYLQGKDLPIPQKGTSLEKGKAISLTEKESAAISSRMLQMIKGNRERIIVSPYSAKASVHKEGETTDIPAEFFGDENEYATVYARIGNLFFVDSSYKNRLPQEIQPFADTNIIFIHDMKNTEFNGSLGYHMANTLATLISSQVAGSVVLDCGTGSGTLALAANRLGAKAVIGVDIGRTAIGQARLNASLNEDAENQTLTFIEADLQDKEAIIPSLEGYSPNDPIVLISNIGSWGDYGITNLTSFSYIPDLRQRGLTVSEVICGGYIDSLNIKNFPFEKAFLQQHGIHIDENERIVQEYDRKVLERLGFNKKVDSQSELLTSPSSSSRDPKKARSQMLRALSGLPSLGNR